MSEPRRTREELLKENRRLRAALVRGQETLAPGGRPGGVSEQSDSDPGRRGSDELFQRLFHLSPAGLALTRRSDGGIIDVNPEFCRLTGYDRDQLLERSAVEIGLWKEEHRREELARRLMAQGIVQDFEFTIRAADDWPVELMGSFQLLTVDGEETILSVLSDISMRKRTERSLREAKREAERAREEAEDLAQFRSSIVTSVTHEVRTPLTVILGFTSILREGVGAPHRRFVDLIERSGRRLLMTLDSVLDLAQLEGGTLEINARPHNILDVVDSVANATRPLAEEKGLAFETDLPDDPLYVEVDSELLARALRHLVDNAVKFTHEGRVTLRVHAEEEAGENGDVLLEVIDTGVGVEEEFVSQLFDTFTQESRGMERDYQGSGMGLTVTAQLVERFGGEVRVESQKDEGSVFAIALPRAERASNESDLHAKAA